jgi:hypothetical protein
MFEVSTVLAVPQQQHQTEAVGALLEQQTRYEALIAQHRLDTERRVDERDQIIVANNDNDDCHLAVIHERHLATVVELQQHIIKSNGEQADMQQHGHQL